MAAPSQPSEFQASVSDILSRVPEKSREVVKNFFDNLDLSFVDKQEIEKAESWIEWARRLKYLKLVSADVPDFILPKDCSGELIDGKVFCKRGPDDQIYDTYPAVRNKVARGNCFLRITRGKHRGTRCILYALKKFTGGLGDDDDRDRGDNHTWKKYFTKPLDQATKIVATRKANGEAAHLSCINIDGQNLICAGSKNVHLLIRNRADIQFYRGDRYRIAHEVCHCIMDCLEEMESEQKDRLLDFLVHTRFTAVFEILVPGHQHVEDLSHLEKPVMQFITWTSTELEPDPQQKLCTVPPHVGIEIAKSLGLMTVDYDVLAASDVESRMKQIRKGYLYEGEVLYFLDETDNVIGLLKKKTVWYIICRAIREKSRNAATEMTKNRSEFSESKVITRTEKRMSEIQSWLGLSDEVISSWKNLGIGFLKWILKKVEAGEKSISDIGDQFPVIWKEFLAEEGLTDNIPVECSEPDTELEQSDGTSASGYS
ncbi:uncharacterized protein LOC101847791 [Aplysia californica]|uniref:Uncharacterized protein LOC101847791 n=1 Tax=Aplysia californica TaxID=6500 RepID=A0ABM1W3I2_APLCA|nr:uncharacterized protein LOC101847791 [Aplysia californica]